MILSVSSGLGDGVTLEPEIISLLPLGSVPPPAADPAPVESHLAPPLDPRPILELLSQDS